MMGNDASDPVNMAEIDQHGQLDNTRGCRLVIAGIDAAVGPPASVPVRPRARHREWRPTYLPEEALAPPYHARYKDKRPSIVLHCPDEHPRNRISPSSSIMAGTRGGKKKGSAHYSHRAQGNERNSQPAPVVKGLTGKM
jgi:hypothetical protein